MYISCLDNITYLFLSYFEQFSSCSRFSVSRCFSQDYLEFPPSLFSSESLDVELRAWMLSFQSTETSPDLACDVISHSYLFFFNKLCIICQFCFACNISQSTCKLVLVILYLNKSVPKSPSNACTYFQIFIPIQRAFFFN